MKPHVNTFSHVPPSLLPHTQLTPGHLFLSMSRSTLPPSSYPHSHSRLRSRTSDPRDRAPRSIDDGIDPERPLHLTLLPSPSPHALIPLLTTTLPIYLTLDPEHPRQHLITLTPIFAYAGLSAVEGLLSWELSPPEYEVELGGMGPRRGEGGVDVWVVVSTARRIAAELFDPIPAPLSHLLSPLLDPITSIHDPTTSRLLHNWYLAPTVLPPSRTSTATLLQTHFGAGDIVVLRAEGEWVEGGEPDGFELEVDGMLALGDTDEDGVKEAMVRWSSQVVEDWKHPAERTGPHLPTILTSLRGILALMGTEMGVEVEEVFESARKAKTVGRKNEAVMVGVVGVLERVHRHLLEEKELASSTRRREKKDGRTYTGTTDTHKQCDISSRTVYDELDVLEKRSRNIDRVTKAQNREMATVKRRIEELERRTAARALHEEKSKKETGHTLKVDEGADWVFLALCLFCIIFSNVYPDFLASGA
ncbi:hypothetical protein G7K_6438-t1 [Saitoella complicata NRRL Y-17804]|uniref:Uncharacterized protein n=1 Tax=Saitoella complicata (strain BCRC 22490 / CBS 7301 / JCM 7358 / NBRC 10748 / NRRL Y-17804) TaxID=698492 RepID=A0A0E9NSG4_SAICN|nr:hypothetical protein G7K_6438-t1 [Saitoella complicata NRRL Y-17804]